MSTPREPQTVEEAWNIIRAQLDGKVSPQGFITLRAYFYTGAVAMMRLVQAATTAEDLSIHDRGQILRRLELEAIRGTHVPEEKPI